MIVQWSDVNECFITTLPEFDNARTHGDTYVEAVQMGRELIESFFMWHEQDGKTLPKPRLYVGPEL